MSGSCKEQLANANYELSPYGNCYCYHRLISKTVQIWSHPNTNTVKLGPHRRIPNFQLRRALLNEPEIMSHLIEVIVPSDSRSHHNILLPTS